MYKFLLIIFLASATLAAQPAEPLRELAEARNFYVGAAIQSRLLLNDDYANTLSREFNMIATEYETKMCEIQPFQGLYDFAATDAMIEFAEAHDMAVRGHTLLWHECFPDWLARQSAQLNREEAIAIMQDHITTVVERYKGRISAWDVVNEAFEDDGRLRQTPWLQMIGPDYIEMAFQFTHDADPDALLFYNDYNAEVMNTKSDAVYEMVADFVARGIPIHGVGLQAHFITGTIREGGHINPIRLTENIERIGELGLQVHITELDLRHDGPATDYLLNLQAENYGEIFDICLAAEACTAVITWGFTDRHTWIPQFFNNPEAAPLLFDRDFMPKPAYFAVAAALAQEETEE